MTYEELWREGTEVLTAGQVPDAALDARYLLLEAFDLDMTHFLLDRSRPLADSREAAKNAAHYRELVGRRARRIPLQQILGTQDFCGLTFRVTEEVLIPRQDTETLVEQVLADCPDPELAVLDLCTGSGCIAVSLAKLGGYRQVDAADLSEEALQLARENAAAQGTDITFYQGDLFAALPAGRSYDILVSNPPYIPSAVIEELEPEVREHEPRMALDGAADGLSFYRRIAGEAGPYLRQGGRIYLEIGYDQGEAVSRLFAGQGFDKIRVLKDLAGHDRIVTAVKESREEATHV